MTVGHFSPTGQCEGHFHFESTDPMHNFVTVDSEEEMFDYIRTVYRGTEEMFDYM